MIKNAISIRVAIIGFGFLLFIAIKIYESSINVGYISVLLIGGCVGAVELLGRYLYAPMRAVLTPSGFSYVIVNMAAAAAAFYMIGPHGFDVFSQAGAATKQSDLLQLKAVLLAGFGALAFMRSSLFKVRVGANEIGIGPAAILDTLLLVADRGVDRQEAILRATEVTNLLKGADPVKGSKLLASYCLALMQNVSAEEGKRIQDSVKKIISEGEYDQEIRLDLIALELSKIVGPTVLEAAVVALGSRLNPVRGDVPSPQSGNAASTVPPTAPSAPSPAQTPPVAPAPTASSNQSLPPTRDEIKAAIEKEQAEKKRE